MSLREPRSKQTGFTLVELMVVLAVVAVILALSAPSLLTLLQKNRLQTAADDFFAGLMLARSEAIKRNQPVVMCKSPNGTACVTADNWEQGWLVYADADADGAVDTNEILRVGDALGSGDTLRVRASPATAGGAFANQLVYRTDGSSSGVTGTETFVFCDADGNLITAREILVTITGRPRRELKTTGICPI